MLSLSSRRPLASVWPTVLAVGEVTDPETWKLLHFSLKGWSGRG